MKRILLVWLATLSPVLRAAAPEAGIVVHADRPGHPVSRHLTGVCIEDVNHEIYGGLYSQMLYGESFQEPPLTPPPTGFKAYGGSWRVVDGELHASGNDGPKLVSEQAPFADGEAGVEMLLADRAAGNAGLIVRVGNAGVGADAFDGYEISLDAAAQVLRLGRHRHNFTLLKDAPCEVPVGQWVALTVKLTGHTLEALVNGRSVIRYEDTDQPLPAGTVGLRPWQRAARYRNLWVKKGDAAQPLAFVAGANDDGDISGMWRAFRRGTAVGHGTVETNSAWIGRQSQSLAFTEGEGEFGIENRGLKRWGLHVEAGKPYEGCVVVRAPQATEVFVALETGDGATILAERKLSVSSSDWQRLDFELTPSATADGARFALKLKRPGVVSVGYAMLQPGAWGRFKGLPVRRDVAEALIDQGITVLRYGGSMINHPEYRWKKMIGPREQRPPHRGTWYPYSSNGWGITDFVAFCEAAGFLSIPAFNMGESPEDMADFVEYVNGPANSPWGRRRAADGHPEPYHLRHLQLGNEERVDDAYLAKFKALAEAIWAKDPRITIVVGDFLYGQPIRDPFNFAGAASGITTLDAHRKILQLAKEHGREVWFDVHVGTDGPRPDGAFAGMFSFIDALEKLADGAKFKVAVFEFNALNHTHRRALANAVAINAIERDGRIPVATSANGLQPDGQNDNGWDQGLLFLNPSRVWLQPPGWVTRMVSSTYQPLNVPVEVAAGGDDLDVCASRSADGKTVVVRVVNTGDRPAPATIRLQGFTPSQPVARVAELAAPLDARNTAEEPGRVRPQTSEWRVEFKDGGARRIFPPYSFTVLRLE